MEESGLQRFGKHHPLIWGSIFPSSNDIDVNVDILLQLIDFSELPNHKLFIKRWLIEFLRACDQKGTAGLH
jgi:hypothetical protein